MTVRRLAVLVNPRGGKQNGIQVLDRVRHIFAAAAIELDVRVTERVGHANEIAKTLDLESIDGVCVIGGDGTIHEVADGLMHRKEIAMVPIGIIPAGTGNALAQHLGCDCQLEAARRIVAGQTQGLDVVRVTLQDRIAYCVNIVGWGVVSDINSTAEKMQIGRAHV